MLSPAGAAQQRRPALGAGFCGSLLNPSLVCDSCSSLQLQLSPPLIGVTKDQLCLKIKEDCVNIDYFPPPSSVSSGN